MNTFKEGTNVKIFECPMNNKQAEKWLNSVSKLFPMNYLSTSVTST